MKSFYFMNNCTITIVNAKSVQIIVFKVKGDDAVKTTKLLSQKHGIFVGISAGANIYAAIQISKKILPGSKIVTILCDTGERYLSTGIFS